MTDVLSNFIINGNQEPTHESTYKNEIILGINDIEELPKGIFLLS